MDLLPEYEQELLEIRNQMLEAQKFAEKFPAFSDKILKNRWDKTFTGTLSETHKNMYFPWGINRWFYKDKANITNYHGDFEPQYLFNIYINQVRLFGDYIETGLDHIHNTVDVYFYDRLNRTFYTTDNQLMPVLDAIVDWYEKAKPINLEYQKLKKREQLQRELDALQ